MNLKIETDLRNTKAIPIKPNFIQTIIMAAVEQDSSDIADYCAIDKDVIRMANTRQ